MAESKLIKKRKYHIYDEDIRKDKRSILGELYPFMLVCGPPNSYKTTTVINIIQKLSGLYDRVWLITQGAPDQKIIEQLDIPEESVLINENVDESISEILNDEEDDDGENNRIIIADDVQSCLKKSPILQRLAISCFHNRTMLIIIAHGLAQTTPIYRKCCNILTVSPGISPKEIRLNIHGYLRNFTVDEFTFIYKQANDLNLPLTLLSGQEKKYLIGVSEYMLTF